MIRKRRGTIWLTIVGLFLTCLITLTGQEPPKTGPETEKRFPPLKVPAGFKATLFACDPLIEYPSVIALGPKTGSLFVAIDYVSGQGSPIVRRSEVRLIEDTNSDGYADKATVLAGNFNSIQGLEYHQGAVYVMHAPFLTMVRDQDGDGKADERRDLLSGLGLPPEKNPSRLHCANGVVAGHDGWLYLALGDNGCDVKRPEGDRLVFQGGGILRCRPDGKDLHVFSTGLRNIYDVALDADLNVFVRDNENDGGDYKIRVCHSFFGADHGYPYLYYERPDEALPPMADLGLGAAAGGVCYLQQQFPAEYRGNLFFAEWNKSVVRYQPERAGSGFFGKVKEIEFATGNDKDAYPFKPTDIVVDRDGSLLVSDWADGQQPKRGRGRIYRITYTQATKPEPKECKRLNTILELVRVKGSEAIPDLIAIATSDAEPRVRAQAVRALADLTDPALVKHRLDAGPGDAAFAKQLAALAKGQEPGIQLEIIVAFGRLRWSETPDWLRTTVTKFDPTLAHAAQQTLRRCSNWPAVLKLLDLPKSEPIRAIALRAIADHAVPELVDGLIERLQRESDAQRRREYADALTRVYKKPGPWVYWGYRPAPRPANTVAWERTDTIGQALDRMLADPDAGVRLATLRRIQREKIPASLGALAGWLRQEKDEERLKAILASLRDHPAGKTRELLEPMVADAKSPTAGRLAALSLLAAGLDEAGEKRLLTVAESMEDGTVLAETLRQLGKRRMPHAASLFLSKLSSPDAPVRAAAIEALASSNIGGASKLAEEQLAKLFHDKDVEVIRAAAAAAGKLGARAAGPTLVKLANHADPLVRRASLESLKLLELPGAVAGAVASLPHPESQLSALAYLADFGGPGQLGPVMEAARRNPSAEVLPLALRMITEWGKGDSAKRADFDDAVADLHGVSGVLTRWQVVGPAPIAATPIIDLLKQPAKVKAPIDQTMFGTGPEARIRLHAKEAMKAGAVWLAYADCSVAAPTSTQFLSGSNSPIRIWLNGKQVHQADQAGAFQADSARFEATLEKGTNRILVQVNASKGDAEFHLRFRRKSSKAEHESFAQAALNRGGNAERGRHLFLNAEKSQCVKCHRIGEQGERIGPDLSGLGNRFSRIHIIESILEPSRTVTAGYQTVVVSLKDGQTLTGVRVAETGDMLTLADNQGKKHTLAKADLDEVQPHPASTMPDGLERNWSMDEFVDLIAFLVSLKENRTTPK